MTEGCTHTIDELVTRYEFHPYFREIYVEGFRDISLLKLFLNEVGREDVKVYEITTINFKNDFDSDLDLDLKSNKRNKIISAAFSLERILSNSDSIRFVADGDFDILLKKNYKCSLLLFSDYTSLELYCFNEKTLTKFLFLYFCGFPKPASFVISELSKVLIELFIIRLTNIILDYNMKWYQHFERCCTCANYIISFDSNEFIKRYLNSNGFIKKREEFDLELDKLREKLTGDVRNQIRGHDFIDVLVYYTRKSVKGDRKKLAKNYSIEGCLFCCLEIEELKCEGLFQSLLFWLNSSQ